MYQYDTDPSQSTGISGGDPFVLLLIPVGIIICLICACTAFICGTGIGYIIRCCMKDEDIQRTRPKNGPNYQRVAIESEREQQAV